MASEILVNDGGAPARILPFTADEAITAGWPLEITTTGKVQGSTANYAHAGFALTSADDEGMCNVIGGSGIIIRAMCKDGTTVGDYMTIGTNRLDDTVQGTGAADDDYVAIALEANASGGDALAKVLVV